MADERNPGDHIENDDPTRMNEEEIVGRADDDGEFEDIEDEDNGIDEND